MKIEEWLDRDGFLHLHKNPEIDESENSPMYYGLLSSVIVIPYFLSLSPLKQGNKFRANANREWGSHFSHDNMTGLYCILKNEGSEAYMRSLPTVYWNRDFWLHPRDLAFYFWAKHPILGFPFIWIASLSMIISCIQKYKVRGNGNKIIKTDGKLLTYMRCKTFNMSITFSICSFFIRHHKYFNNWNDVAVMYFKDVDHPLRKLIK